MSAGADTAEVRAGEELDVAALAAWLADAVPRLAGEPIGVRQFPKGHSNLTYLLHVGGEELVLRRPPFGRRAPGAHDMGREYRILKGLSGHYPLAPGVVAACEDERVLGAPFYLMERLRGVIVRKKMPPGLPSDPASMGRLTDALIGNLVDIHATDWRAAGLGELYKGEGYVERQISGWTRRWERAKTDEVPEVDRVAAWLAAHLPAEAAPTLIHNDYKHDNVVLAATSGPGTGWEPRIVGVLDWEMATVGDPLMDLGTTLGYWIEEGDPKPLQAFAFCPTNLPGAGSRRDVVERYAALSGREVGDPVFYFAYGLFKLAVVAQQIYQRFKSGATKDQRFAQFLFGVKVLGMLATTAIDKGRIDRLG